MKVGLIWAQTSDGVIGADNAIPWRVPEDTAHFKAVTRGHPVVMGRRTWDSLPERFRPLPGRRNIVITRQRDWSAPGAQPAASLDEALRLAASTRPHLVTPAATPAAPAHDERVWVMGGGEIYRAAMDHATELMVTEIAAEFPGDVYAPAIGPDWTPADGPWQQSTNGLRYRFRHYTR